MPDPQFVKADIDAVPIGTMVYSAPGIPLGVVREYRQMNGNSPSILHRHLDNGKHRDRFAYRREALYMNAKEDGVYVRAANCSRYPITP